jgi:chemotaxis protein MotA
VNQEFCWRKGSCSVDFATVGGLIFGLIVVTFAIGKGGDFSMFVNLQGFVIVLGGTFSATMIKFPLSAFFIAMPLGLKAALSSQGLNPIEMINQSMEFSKQARQDQRKLLIIEDSLNKVKDALFRKGLQLCIDGFDQKYIRDMLNQEMDQAITRQEQSYKIFYSIAESAPAFGMFGTLVGLIQMLSALDDPTAIGAGLAVALLTTMYGVLISYLFAQPIAEKLDQKAGADQANRVLMIECICLIQEMKNPTQMWDFLESYLPQNLRRRAGKDNEAENSGEITAKKNNAEPST